MTWNKHKTFQKEVGGERFRVPTGGRCLPCSLAVMVCFVDDWNEVLRKVKSIVDFAKLFGMVRNFLKNKDPATIKTFVEQEVATLKIFGTRVEAVMDFITESQFQEQMGMSPEAAQVSVVETFDEKGNLVRGIPIKPPGTDEIKRRYLQFCEELLLKKDRPFRQ